MDTNLTQQQNNGGVQPSGVQPQPQGQLDPSVVALTKSIGKAESGGNYNSPSGDAGSPKSAYQFTPGFLQDYGQKYLGNYDPNNLSPEQQDKLAYGVVHEWGTSGMPNRPELGALTPAQIASAWNTGDPHAYLDPDHGKNNNYGSTENYVNKVAQNYSEITGQPSTPQAPIQGKRSMDKPDWLALGEVGAGLGGLALALPWLLGPEVGAPVDAALIGAGGAGTAVAGVAGAAKGIIPKVLQYGKNALKLGGEGLAATKATELVDKAISGGQQPISPETGIQMNQQTPLPETNQSSQAHNIVRDALSQSLSTTTSNRNFSNTPEGQSAISTASMFGLISPDENGILQFDENKRKQLLGDVSQAQDSIIAAQGGGAGTDLVDQYAQNYVDGDRYATANERQEANKYVQKELEAQGVPKGGQMSLEDMRQAQKEHYSAAQRGYREGRTSSHILAHKALGNAYGRVIRENMRDPVLYDRTKKMEQALINAKQVGKRLSGRKALPNTAPWQTFLRGAGRYAEIYIGDKLGGPLGAILGAMAGEHINKSIDKKFGKNIFETPDMRAALDILHDTKPDTYNNLLTQLKKQGVDIKHKEIGPSNDVTVEGLIKRLKGKKVGINDLDKLVNEVQQEKTKGVIQTPKGRKRGTPSKYVRKELGPYLEQMKNIYAKQGVLGPNSTRKS